MENHLITDNMLSTKKKGKSIFSVDNYAKVSLFPASTDTMSSSKGRGVERISLSKIKNKRYY